MAQTPITNRIDVVGFIETLYFLSIDEGREFLEQVEGHKDVKDPQLISQFETVEKRTAPFLGRVCRCRFDGWGFGTVNDMIESFKDNPTGNPIQYYVFFPLKTKSEYLNTLKYSRLDIPHERSILAFNHFPDFQGVGFDESLVMWTRVFQNKV